jgi:acetyltransferase-like isoleucine patch superfamily enzyme
MERSDFSLAWSMPWAISYEIRRYLALPYIRLMFSLHGIKWGKRWRIWGMPIIQRFRGSQIKIGDGVMMRSWKSTNPLTPNHPVVLATRSAKALIDIGKEVGMSGATIVAADRIEIGTRTFIGANATIVDTDFHPLDPMKRQTDGLGGEYAPVVIGKDVFIGLNSIILKGVRVGDGAVIGAGGVVVDDVPSRAVVAGNPARVVRYLEESSA